MKKYISLFSIFLFCLTLSLFLAPSAFASTLRLTPASAKIGVGNTQAVSVYLNTAGESINGVSAYLSYPADKLDIAYITYGSTFSIAAEGSYGGGGIRISRGSISGASGNILVATIGFKGKTEGTANVSFIGGSAAPRTADSSDSLTGSTGGTYTVAKGIPAVTTAPIAAVKISDIAVTDITTTSATISWNTDIATVSHVAYGLEKDSYFVESDPTKRGKTHSVTLTGPLITPGALLHFRVVVPDRNGTETTSEDTKLQIKGYTVGVKLTDKNNKPIPQQKILLYSTPTESVTDENGIATFQDISPGKHLVLVKTADTEQSQDIIVTESDSPQTFPITLKPKENQSQTTLSPILLLIPVVFILLVLLILFLRKRKHSSGSAPTVVVEQPSSQPPPPKPPSV